MFNVFSSSVHSDYQQQPRTPGNQAPTYGYHALAIIIQVLHQHLTETVHLAFAAFGEIPRQKPILLLHSMHQICQFLYHALVRAKIVLLGQHDTEVEYELIAVVAGRFHADGISEDAVSVCAHL